MKKSTIFLLMIVVVLIFVVAGYLIAKVKYGGKMELNWKREILGTWTTEDGGKSLIIRKGYLYFKDEYGEEGPCTYVTKDLYFNKDGTFYVVLKPAKNNQAGTLGMYEEIIHRNNSLIGGIMIYDLEYNQTEFRKDWSPVAKN